MSVDMMQGTEQPQNSLKPDLKLPLTLLILGMNLEFARRFINTLRRVEGGLEGSAGLQMLAAICMIAAGWIILRRGGWDRTIRGWRRWIVFVVLWSVIMLAHGVYVLGRLDRVTIYRLLLEWFPYCLFLTVFLGTYRETWSALNKWIILHTVIGVITMAWEISRLTTFERSLMRSAAFVPLYGYPVLLLTWQTQGWIGRLVAVLGASAALIGGLYRDDRGIVLGVLVYILLSVYVQYRSRPDLKSFREPRSLSMPAALLICIILLSAILTADVLVWSGRDQIFLGHWGSLIRRFSEGVAEPTSEARYSEIEILSSQLSPLEWFLGKGLNVPWEGYEIYGTLRYTIHVGYAHFIYQGGLVLLLLMLGPIVLGWKRLLTQRDETVLAGAGILAQWTVGLFSLANPSVGPGFAILCLSIGACVAIPVPQPSIAGAAQFTTRQQTYAKRVGLLVDGLKKE